MVGILPHSFPETFGKASNQPSSPPPNSPMWERPKIKEPPQYSLEQIYEIIHDQLRFIYSFTHEYATDIGILLVIPILPHKHSSRPRTTHRGFFVGTVQELANSYLEDSVEIISEEDNEGPAILENLEGEYLEASENGENFEILENKGNLENNNEISDLESEKEHNKNMANNQKLAWMSQGVLDIPSDLHPFPHHTKKFLTN